jgi:hypothetical protein
MKTHIVRGVALVFVLGLCFNALPVFAEQIQIHVTGLNFKYDGTDIFDSVNKVGGNLNTAQADPLTTIDFFKDDAFVGNLTAGDNIFADLLIKNVLNINKNGGMITTGDGIPGFGFDLLQNTGSQTNTLLSLNVNHLTLSYSGYGIFIAVGGLVDSIVDQNLPFGLKLSTTDQVSLLFSSSNLTNVGVSGDYLSRFEAFGTSDINGKQVVPEPTSAIALLSLAATGLMSLVVSRRRKSA